jgi:flagellar protein FlgJ
MDNNVALSSQQNQINHAQARTYTDLSGLDSIKQQAQTDRDGALREVARQFESVFLNIVLKSMRDANESFADNDLFNTQQSKMYREMYDQQLSLSMTEGEGLGLADMLVKQLGQFVDRSAQNPDVVTDEPPESVLSAQKQQGLQAYKDLKR